ncbi:hypothetical protein N7495_000872 [Penicillium taxi]|uniref:uncharacterized protein n=1 Tax=Penicillium taxi TaxID=168475 RepID=UPI002544D937|nr:uncharacterized protein N7495_000872 [Penicillium taxi]KAJ5908190.1 hypothetical protein N7495_000872 [Penicillium taxi]
METSRCDQSDDSLFGPENRGCRDGTDFTLLFEQSIFSILPYAIFKKKSSSKIFRLSMISILCLGGLQVSLIILYALPDGDLTDFSLPAACVSIIASLCLIIVRTLWLRGDHQLIAIVFLSTVLLKFTILKRYLLKQPYAHYAPEVLASFFNMSVFWWLNSLLMKGSSYTI